LKRLIENDLVNHFTYPLGIDFETVCIAFKQNLLKRLRIDRGDLRPLYSQHTTTAQACKQALHAAPAAVERTAAGERSGHEGLIARCFEHLYKINANHLVLPGDQPGSIGILQGKIAAQISAEPRHRGIVQINSAIQQHQR